MKFKFQEITAMKSNNKFVLGMMVVPLALVGIGVTYASNVGTPIQFVGGTPALASEVNSNFSDHASAINNNDSGLKYLRNAPAFHAALSSVSQVFQVGDTVVCNSEILDDWDSSGVFLVGTGYDSNLGRYKAPRSGIYKFTFRTNMIDHGVITLKKNGTESLGSIWELTDDDNSSSITVIVRLNLGDLVQPVVEGSSVEIWGTNNPNRMFTTFSGHWLRP